MGTDFDLSRTASRDIFNALRYVVRSRIQAHGKKQGPTACVLDSRTLHSTPESGKRAGFDAGKKRKGSKLHRAVDTLGYSLHRSWS
jgi:hypothetical protein